MKRVININKKIILFLLIVNIIIIAFGSSYALFETTLIRNDVLKLQTGNTKISTIIENYSDNLITLSGGDSKTLNITLTNESSDYDILYKMYYTIESGEGLILVTDATSDTSGTMKGEKSLSLTIQNNNASDLSIKIETIGALLMEEITLLDGQYELIGDTDAPVVTNATHIGDGKITFTVSDSGSGVDKYCVNQNAEDTTNCTWITAVEGEQTTDVITSENGNYYVHVKDLAGNIGHSNVVTISFSISATDFITQNYGTGGLIAVNTSGTLYDGTGTIREYRYSGATVNNYVFFDTDGDGVKDTNEIWRIIGIFKKSSNWQLKLIRDTALTSAELPDTYTYNGTEFEIESDTAGHAFKGASSGIVSDWTTTGLQYYLNGTDGYYGTISTQAQALIDTSYTYYLGNVGASSQYGTTASYSDGAMQAYSNERNSTACWEKFSNGQSFTSSSHAYNCYVWYGNKAKWSGKIALLYPSDYGYAADSIYWDGLCITTNCYALDSFDDAPINTSWMKNYDYLWLISPSSSYRSSNLVIYGDSVRTTGYVLSNNRNYYAVFPVLNLLSSAPIDVNHQGTLSDPYVLVLE